MGVNHLRTWKPRAIKMGLRIYQMGATYLGEYAVVASENLQILKIPRWGGGHRGWTLTVRKSKLWLCLRGRWWLSIRKTRMILWNYLRSPVRRISSSWDRHGIQLNEDDQKEGWMLYLHTFTKSTWKKRDITHFAPSIWRMGPDMCSINIALTRIPSGLYHRTVNRNILEWHNNQPLRVSADSK